MVALQGAWLRLGVTSGLGVACLLLYRQLRAAKEVIANEKRLRGEERTGRTRAEVALRNLKKRSIVADGSAAPLSADKVMKITAIGFIKTPFVKRAGTPRQGTVCPSSRGVLVLEKRDGVTPSTLDGLEKFSHAWVIFEFHANTDDPLKRRASKIAPPRGGGGKVGWLATRSPHRVNALGLSLVKIESVDANKLKIHLSSVDLCDGTPIYDVKPFVPWDQPETYVVPAWVSQQDELDAVEWDADARDALRAHARLVEPYGYAGDVDGAERTISELLAQDPRNKRCRAAAKAERDDRGQAAQCGAYKIHFAGVEVEFVVDRLVCKVVGVKPVADVETADLLRVDLLRVGAAAEDED
ncbi:TsaA-like domain-containing protein [Pelagophyceae sp. CCMP2097]|nr:TsaA-like domain-containing protein [Pelagophyceae sp. CCMP2097]